MRMWEDVEDEVRNRDGRIETDRMGEVENDSKR
jgi:hypothetical protein